MKHTLFTIVTAFLASISAYAQTEVESYRPGITSDGIVYFLPKTHLHITIETECTKSTPGEYAPYASHFLRLDDVSQKPSERWTIKSISVTPYGVADRSRAYTIRMKPKTSAPLVSLTEGGCLIGINTETDQPEPLSQPRSEVFVSNAIDASKYKTPEILNATSIRKAAEMAAAEIYDIRESRTLLNKGQADFMPKDNEQFKQMINNLNEQETALLQLFIGTESKEHHTYTIDLTPGAFDGNPIVLFRFSKQFGVSDAEDLIGDPYYIALTDEHSLPPVEENPKAKKKELEDLRYCKSGTGLVSITDNDRNIIYNNHLAFSQLGRIEHLGGDLFNKRFNTRVTLSHATGDILHIEGEPVK